MSRVPDDKKQERLRQLCTHIREAYKSFTESLPDPRTQGPVQWRGGDSEMFAQMEKEKMIFYKLRDYVPKDGRVRWLYRMQLLNQKFVRYISAFQRMTSKSEPSYKVRFQFVAEQYRYKKERLSYLSKMGSNLVVNRRVKQIVVQGAHSVPKTAKGEEEGGGFPGPGPNNDSPDDDDDKQNPTDELKTSAMRTLRRIYSALPYLILFFAPHLQFPNPTGGQTSAPTANPGSFTRQAMPNTTDPIGLGTEPSKRMESWCKLPEEPREWIESWASPNETAWASASGNPRDTSVPESNDTEPKPIPEGAKNTTMPDAGAHTNTTMDRTALFEFLKRFFTESPEGGEMSGMSVVCDPDGLCDSLANVINTFESQMFETSVYNVPPSTECKVSSNIWSAVCVSEIIDSVKNQTSGTQRVVTFFCDPTDKTCLETTQMVLELFKRAKDRPQLDKAQVKVIIALDQQKISALRSDAVQFLESLSQKLGFTIYTVEPSVENDASCAQSQPSGTSNVGFLFTTKDRVFGNAAKINLGDTLLIHVDDEKMLKTELENARLSGRKTLFVLGPNTKEEAQKLTTQYLTITNPTCPIQWLAPNVEIETNHLTFIYEMFTLFVEPELTNFTFDVSNPGDFQLPKSYETLGKHSGYTNTRKDSVVVFHRDPITNTWTAIAGLYELEQYRKKKIARIPCYTVVVDSQIPAKELYLRILKILEPSQYCRTTQCPLGFLDRVVDFLDSIGPQVRNTLSVFSVLSRVLAPGNSLGGETGGSPQPYSEQPSSEMVYNIVSMIGGGGLTGKLG